MVRSLRPLVLAIAAVPATFFDNLSGAQGVSASDGLLFAIQ